MTIDDFWAVISQINVKGKPALDTADCSDRGLKRAAEILSQQDVTEIEAFQEYLSKSLYDLDGKKYADHAGLSGGSGDGFLYARCWVVAQGKDHYEKVLHTPKEMTDDEEQWCEGLCHVAHEAWGLKTGNDPMEWDFEPKYDYESFSNQALWQ